MDRKAELAKQAAKWWKDKVLAESKLAMPFLDSFEYMLAQNIEAKLKECDVVVLETTVDGPRGIIFDTSLSAGTRIFWTLKFNCIMTVSESYGIHIEEGQQ